VTHTHTKIGLLFIWYLSHWSDAPVSYTEAPGILQRKCLKVAFTTLRTRGHSILVCIENSHLLASVFTAVNITSKSYLHDVIEIKWQLNL